MVKRLGKTFVVEGRGPFPPDMLRYDSCTFATEGDRYTAMQYVALRRVKMRFNTSLQTAVPSKLHWDMVGWTVLDEGDMV